MVEQGLSMADLQAFSSTKDRARLSRLALRAYRRIAQCWGLDDHQAADLLGVAPNTWESWTEDDWSQDLSQEQMTRISAFLGIYQDLHMLFRDGMADRWPMLSNQNPFFSGMSPVDCMIGGDTARLLDIRRQIEGMTRSLGGMTVVP
jgi:hypothetical protein